MNFASAKTRDSFFSLSASVQAEKMIFCSSAIRPFSELFQYPLALYAVAPPKMRLNTRATRFVTFFCALFAGLLPSMVLGT